MPGPVSAEPMGGGWHFCPVCGADWRAPMGVVGISSTEFDMVVATMCMKCHNWWRRESSTTAHLSDRELAELEGLAFDAPEG